MAFCKAIYAFSDEKLFLGSECGCCCIISHFLEDRQENLSSEKQKHATAKGRATIAKEANVELLILGPFSLFTI